MKKNRVFLSMLGLSAALHGLVMIGVPDNDFRTLPPARQEKIVSTLTMIKAGTPLPAEAQSTPTEKKIVEKLVEPRLELPPVQETLQETVNSEEIQEDDEAQERSNDTGNNTEAPEGEAGEGGANEAVPEGGAVTGREYEALLAYIKNFINKNLVYPPMARRRNIEGVVTVRFEIESNGRLAAIMVDHSSGSSILDNAAVTLIEKMHSLNNTAIKRKLALRVNIEYKLTE
ncbi:MAG: TonB family protein [Treponema sp.]|jgi:protein TonB|nr:TonB family protein [Treponema sp.]